MTKRAHGWARVASVAALLLGGCALGDEPGAGIDAPAGGGSIAVNGEPADERILAELQPDDDTTVTFIRSDTDGGDEFSVDVVIVGRDGGPDYGALIQDRAATPLELYVALAGPAAAAPEELRRAHVWEARMTRGGDEQVRAAVLAAAAPGAGEIDNTIALSTYSCLSWDNFVDQMSNQFVGAPGRNQMQSWGDTGTHALYSPSPWASWNGGRTDIYVCNYNSAGNTPDSIRAELCHRTIDNDEACFLTTLADGHYARRLYGPTVGLKKYFGLADPLPSGNVLLNFIGIVRRN